jgi:hypothetical protein
MLRNDVVVRQNVARYIKRISFLSLAKIKNAFEMNSMREVCNIVGFFADCAANSLRQPSPFQLGLLLKSNPFFNPLNCRLTRISKGLGGP